MVIVENQISALVDEEENIFQSAEEGTSRKETRGWDLPAEK